ncbi:MAG: RnfABCDGE type electron transport complex subunit D [Ruminococcus flavefaciens]|nr:RnfABCDGE type electron transport complex subunit D [Ruminococcus flavefaciens]MCM1060231.1 RnfABCDGE type electron transport complex subunit D [Eubacterium sp.]
MLKKARKERLIWIDITITLLALELMSYFYYGIRSLVLGGVCVAVSLLTEMISLRLMHKSFTADDLMCTSDALIISLMMPAVMDYKIAAIACVFAVTAAKNIFGGRKNMIFSPAVAAYVFMLASWEKKLLLYPEPHVRTGLFDMPDGLVSSASYVYNTTGKMDYTDFEILLGNFSGSAGSASILLLIVAAVILIFRRDISAGAFIGTILGTGFLAYIMPVSASLTAADSVKYSLVTNMVLFAAIYIISDKRIAPKREYYAFFYGLFIAFFSYIVLLTTAKENVIIIISILFTPVALGFRNLEKKIELAYESDLSPEPESDDADGKEADSE